MSLKRQTSIHLLNEVLVQPLRILVQSEPRSHTEHVNFEPILVMVSLAEKDFHVVRAFFWLSFTSCLRSKYYRPSFLTIMLVWGIYFFESYSHLS
ncbi:hypothetical protein BH23THE1_BH23THE1_33780 [soil metagenome]